MDDRPADDMVPDPTAEPEGGAASGSGPSGGDAEGDAVEKADNGERMLDRDRESEDPEEDAASEVERMETHNRDRSED